MANNETEKKSVTGLDQAENRKEAEYDLVTGLLEAAEYKTSDNNITKVDIKRAGRFLFSVHIHPISDQDSRFARKKSTIYIPNPNGKKLPPIEKERNTALFNSWLIYLATTEEDQEKVWNNPRIMQKFGLAQPYESIDILLTLGEKAKVIDLILEISGLEDDEDGEEFMDEEEFAKN